MKLIESIKLGAKMASVIKGLTNGELEYKQLVMGSNEDKFKYIQKMKLEIIGVIVKK